MTGDRLAFALISTIYLIVAIPFEEAALVRELRRRVPPVPDARAMANVALRVLKKLTAPSLVPAQAFELIEVHVSAAQDADDVRAGRGA